MDNGNNGNQIIIYGADQASWGDAALHAHVVVEPCWLDQCAVEAACRGREPPATIGRGG